MAIWRRIKNSMSVVVVVAIVLYVAYCTEELYSRVQNNRKFYRLQEYEKEVREQVFFVYTAARVFPDVM